MLNSFSKNPRLYLTVAMLSLVVWNLAEFALQSVKRPLFNESLILAATLGVLLFLPWIFNGKHKAPVYGALIGGGIHLAFGILGVFASPIEQGFGKYGPGVAAILLVFVVGFAARTLLLERHNG